MFRRIVTIVLVAGTPFSVYLLAADTVQQQTTDATSAGITPNRDCTCPVRLESEYALDAGLSQYQRLTFPCSRRVQVDGGIDITLPPMPKQRVRDAIDVVDWNDCTLVASTAPVAALWGTQRPFITAGVAKPWCRAKLDAGLPCLLLDGGSFDTPGQRGAANVSLCTKRANPATCERVSGGTIYAGDNDEEL